MEKGSKHIILYAEDDLDDLSLVKDCFKEFEQVELVHAFDGHQAIQTLNQLAKEGTLPCLIILDINMPAMDGRQTLIQIKQSDSLKNIPVVMFTTSNSMLDKEFARKWGADFITKPLKYAEVIALADEFSKRCNFEISKRT